MKKQVSRLIGLSVAIMALGGFATANAFASNLVDGSVTASGHTCSWTNGTTSADPPSALTIDHNSVNAGLSCSGASGQLNNDPSVTFDDTAGTATANLVDVTVVVSGVSCEYTASNYAFTRSGTTRTYSGSATAQKKSGSIFCPSSVSTSSTVTFH
jgi:hypothetical protein